MTTKKEDTRHNGNYKPYRTKAQKAEASRTAVKCEDGTWRSTAPVSYHKRKEGRQ
jgi:hypothetical protein